MVIPLKYKLTQEMLNLISKLEVKKALFENIQINADLVTNFQRKSLLKSSLFSAKIEGNTLNISDLYSLSKFDLELKERVEVENIISAFSFINENKEIDMEFILDLHKIVLTGLIDYSGLRKEPSAIFNESGFAVYMPPPPSQIKDLLSQLILYINEQNKEHALIRAFLSYISFEKIHPFIDGNGRVGRLLLWTILLKNKYSFKGLISIEEILNERKQEYYAYLDKNDATSFIEFMLEIMNIEAQRIIDELTTKEYTKEDSLLPRRKEIIDTIRDHGVVSMDFIRRRFLKVSARMIRFDLQKLEQQGYIIKLGTTKGAMYKIK